MAKKAQGSYNDSNKDPQTEHERRHAQGGSSSGVQGSGKSRGTLESPGYPQDSDAGKYQARSEQDSGGYTDSDQEGMTYDEQQAGKNINDRNALNDDDSPEYEYEVLDDGAGWDKQTFNRGDKVTLRQSRAQQLQLAGVRLTKVDDAKEELSSRHQR